MIYRRMLKSKIHRARVTHAHVDYEGSITLSPTLLKAANLLASEAVHVWNVTSGTRFETYIITGKEDSKDICVNGAAAHLVRPGDIIIIASFIQMPDDLCSAHLPIAVFVDEHNVIKEIRQEQPAILD